MCLVWRQNPQLSLPIGRCACYITVAARDSRATRYRGVEQPGSSSACASSAGLCDARRAILKHSRLLPKITVHFQSVTVFVSRSVQFLSKSYMPHECHTKKSKHN